MSLLLNMYGPTAPGSLLLDIPESLLLDISKSLLLDIFWAYCPGLLPLFHIFWAYCSIPVPTAQLFQICERGVLIGKLHYTFRFEGV